MKRFNSFGEYMFNLLFGPLKRGKHSVNQLYIFLKVIGRIFDGMKSNVFRVRNEANVATASPIMLPVHGQDRGMPRLIGENSEAYRTRLSMKGIISVEAGTKQGILRSLVALGYEKSYIEPFSVQDTDRWAEFIVFLRGAKQSGINDLDVVDREVRKVKEGSSKPAYGIETSSMVAVVSELKMGVSWYPRCGEIVCGIFPRVVSEGYLVGTSIVVQSMSGSGDINFPKVATVAASQKFYHRYNFIQYEGIVSDIEIKTKQNGDVKNYPLCSQRNYLKGGNN